MARCSPGPCPDRGPRGHRVEALGSRAVGEWSRWCDPLFPLAAQPYFSARRQGVLRHRCLRMVLSLRYWPGPLELAAGVDPREHVGDLGPVVVVALASGRQAVEPAANHLLTDIVESDLSQAGELDGSGASDTSGSARCTRRRVCSSLVLDGRCRESAGSSSGALSHGYADRDCHRREDVEDVLLDERAAAFASEIDDPQLRRRLLGEGRVSRPSIRRRGTTRR